MLDRTLHVLPSYVYTLRYLIFTSLNANDVLLLIFFFLMIRRPPRSTPIKSSAAQMCIRDSLREAAKIAD